MRDRCRFCIRRAAGLLCSFVFALIVGLAPQLSSAAVELAVEVETVEVTAAGAQRRALPSHRAMPPLTLPPVAALAAARDGSARDASPGLSGHRLPNGSCAPLRC